MFHYLKKLLSPLVIALVLGLLVPTICVLWFMFNSMESEKLANIKRLEEFYQRDMIASVGEVEKFWQKRLDSANEIAANKSPQLAFSLVSSEPNISGAIIWNNDGIKVYPSDSTSSVPISVGHAQWLTAQKLEFIDKNYSQAYDAYRGVFLDTSQVNKRQMVLIAMARTAQLKGDSALAIAHYKELSESSWRNESAEVGGRNIAADSALRLLELIIGKDPKQEPEITQLIRKFVDRLNDYETVSIPTPQRIFLSERVLEIAQGYQFEVTFPLLKAEKTSDEIAHNFEARTRVFQAGGHDYIVLYRPDHRITLIVDKDEFIRSLYALNSAKYSDANIAFEIRDSGATGNQTGQAFLTWPFKNELQGLTLEASWKDAAAATRSSEAKIALYLWTGAVVIILLVILYIFVVFQMRKQERLQQLRNDVIATVSHELKTPLTSIRLLVENMLAAPDQLTPTVRDYIEIISNENYRLGNLVDNFMTFSRMQRGKHSFSFELVTVGVLVQESLNAVSNKFNKYDVHVNIDLADEEQTLLCDASMIKTVIINILDNACKYTFDNKRVVIKSISDATYFYLSITDNGEGIAAADLERIFDRFYRVDQRLSRRAEGCGLGLNISAYIVKSHQGEILVKSEVGVGSTFTIKLPLRNREQLAI